MTELWKLTILLHRQKENQPARLQTFSLEISPEEYVIDVVERLWAFEDRSITFRHACHHSTCGACGMRVNNVEKLTCITKIRDVTHNGGTLKIEPLRNFPVVSDVVVDLTPLYAKMEAVQAQAVVSLRDAPAEGDDIRRDPDAPSDLLRLADCIECGLCISACPAAATHPEYLGPAPLAAAQLNGVQNNPGLLALVDSAEGAWRCHSAYECTAVCPSNVQPGWRIMDLRKQIMVARVKALFK